MHDFQKKHVFDENAYDESPATGVVVLDQGYQSFPCLIFIIILAILVTLSPDLMVFDHGT